MRSDCIFTNADFAGDRFPELVRWRMKLEQCVRSFGPVGRRDIVANNDSVIECFIFPDRSIGSAQSSSMRSFRHIDLKSSFIWFHHFVNIRILSNEIA